MFTGIIEGLGRVVRMEPSPKLTRLFLDTGAVGRKLAKGASLAVNGVCLTVVSRRGGVVAVEAVPETLRLTNLGELRVGDVANLERPLAVNGRLDGHFVMGHVDGTAVLQAVRRDGGSRRLTYRVSGALTRQMIHKGSVCIDGISLTLTKVGATSMDVAIIPHTWQVTNMSRRRVGDRVNVEVDMLGKYVRRCLANA